MRLPILILTLAAIALNAWNSSGSPQKLNVLFNVIDAMNDWTTLFDKSNPIKWSR